MHLPEYLTYALLALTWAVLLGAPVAGFLIRRLQPGRDAVLLVLMATALVPALGVSGISTSSHTLNLACFFAAYAGYCFLASYSLTITARGLRLVAVLIAYLPVAAAYAFATIGALATVYLLAQSYPLSRQEIRPGLACEISGWGMAGATASGYDINLYRSPPSFPWVRLLARSDRVTVPPGAIGPWPGCAEAVKQYDHRP